MTGIEERTVTRGRILIEDVVKIYDPKGAAVMAVDHAPGYRSR